jgi:glycosyltransferase involved in cell wall biosynthesis
MTLSLVIPAFNEEQRLRPFLASISEYVLTHPSGIDELLVIDDGSTDQTVEVANAFKSQLLMLSVIKHVENQGKGAAVQTGVLAAQGDYIVFMDADGATSINELPRMLSALGSAQVAIGNRWMAGAKTARHSFMRVVAGWANRQYMHLFGLGEIDTMCGFKGYHRDSARVLFKDLLEKRWLFDTEIAYKAKRLGLSIKNFPITWESKDGSKLSTFTLVKAAFNIWPLIHRLNRQLPKGKAS